MPFVVRRLYVGDEEVVRRLTVDEQRFEQAGVPARKHEPHTVESAREFLAVESNVLLVAFDDGEPVGQLLAYQLIRRHGDGRILFIYEIGVRDDHRRAGVGRALFEALAADCRERSVSRAFVITNEGNEPAMAFYRSLGATRDATDETVFDFDWS